MIITRGFGDNQMIITQGFGTHITIPLITPFCRIIDINDENRTVILS